MTRTRRDFASPRAAAVALGIVGALLVTSCSAPSTSTSRTAVTDRRSSPPSGRTAPSPAASPAPSRVPATGRTRGAKGFRPWTVSAISAKRIWVLGRTACPASACPAAAYQSSDGGTTWRRLRLPATLLQTDPTGADHGVSGIAFATASTGWLFGPDLWVTHTGGRSWRRVDVPGDVESLAVGRGAVWAMVGVCPSGKGCAALALMRATIPSGRFIPVTLPSPLIGGGPVPSLTASGRTVAVLTNLPPVPDGDHDLLQVTTDGGLHWQTRPAPCINELGGTLAASGSAVWATCPTGSLAAVYLSTGGPFTQVSVFGGPLPSFTSVTAVSQNTALIGIVGTRAFRTTNSGVGWRRVHLPPPARHSGSLAASFPSTGHGYAVAVAPRSAKLLRTDDGGLHWRVVPIR